MRVVDDDGADVPAGEVGEIAIRGHNVMKGYWNSPKPPPRPSPDGWFRTGDMARVDEDGFYFIVDRKKDLIIRGGYNVYPREIEEVLHEHPAVAEAAVIGLPHAELGEEVGAAVALKPGASATPEELRAFVENGWRPTSTRAASGWSTRCPKDRPARSCAERCTRPKRTPVERRRAGASRGAGAGRGATGRGAGAGRGPGPPGARPGRTTRSTPRAGSTCC